MTNWVLNTFFLGQPDKLIHFAVWYVAVDIIAIVTGYWLIGVIVMIVFAPIKEYFIDNIPSHNDIWYSWGGVILWMLFNLIWS